MSNFILNAGTIRYDDNILSNLETIGTVAGEMV